MMLAIQSSGFALVAMAIETAATPGERLIPALQAIKDLIPDRIK